jgi:hypothetical protein
MTARAVRLADDMAGQEEALRDLERRAGEIRGEDGRDLRAALADTTRSVRLMSEVNASQAIAYDQLLRGGGPDDPAAFEAYQRDTERNIALLPNVDEA